MISQIKGYPNGFWTDKKYGLPRSKNDDDYLQNQLKKKFYLKKKTSPNCSLNTKIFEISKFVKRHFSALFLKWKSWISGC